MNIQSIPYIAHLIGFIGTLYEINTLRRQTNFAKEALPPTIIGLITLLLWFVYDYENRAALPAFFLLVAIVTNLYVLYRTVRDKYYTTPNTRGYSQPLEPKSSVSRNQSVFDPRTSLGYKTV